MLMQKNILQFILTVLIVCNAMVWWSSSTMVSWRWTYFLFCWLHENKMRWIKLVLSSFLYFWHILYKVLNTLMFLQDNLNVCFTIFLFLNEIYVVSSLFKVFHFIFLEETIKMDKDNCHQDDFNSLITRCRTYLKKMLKMVIWIKYKDILQK